ncbi:MAG: monovalent cation/H(+) antiporter subunit G [Acidobacteria bacterium]|nr:monovalent cation/H(+) antiporter subunit G [Acidobacteriota bacterium]
MNTIATLMMVVGFGFILAGVVGILRLPDFYCRLHAMGKCDTLGVALMIGGVAVLEGWTLTAAKLLLVVVFVTLANPTVTHALGRAAVRSGLAPWSGKETPS